MNTYYVPNGNTWAQAVASYFGKNGEWKQQNIKFVSRNGRWVEVVNTETNDGGGILNIEKVSLRAGMPHQADFILSGNFITSAIVPDPVEGAFYRLRNNLSDYYGNFPGVILNNGTPNYNPNYGIYLSSNNSQHIETNATGDGYDLLGVIGSNGSKHWEIGCKFSIDALPVAEEKKFVFYSGTETQYIAAWCNNYGDLNCVFVNGAYIQTLTSPAVVTPQTQLGFVFRHRVSGGLKYLELETSNEDATSVQINAPYWSPTPNTPVKFFTGLMSGSETTATNFFLPSNTHSVLTISGDGLELTGTQIAYRSSIPSGWMNPNTGRYYIQILNRTSYDIQFGVTDALVIDTTQPPGLIGWAVNTISGRKFAKQTGGGTNWTAAMAADSTLGLVYDSDLGTIEVYVNGTKLANPFDNGIITQPVRFIIGGRAETASVKIFNPAVRVSSQSWVNPPAGTYLQIPMSSVISPGAPVYTSGYISDLFIRNTPMSSPERTLAVINPNLSTALIFTNKDTLVEHNVSNYVIKMTQNEITSTVPNLPPGNYSVSFSIPGYTTSNTRFFTIKQPSSRSTNLFVNFSKDSLATINGQLMAAHKQWGGANGGVSSECVKVVGGVCELHALGDQYTGPILGVDRLGNPSGFNTRIGASLVTRDYFGPGSYRVVCKSVQVPGVCNALWTFHYQEAYEGVPIYDIIESRGLRQQGDEVNGFYIVENNEIDIEFPTALKSNPDQEDVSFLNARFNTWQGELRNYDVDDSDPTYWSEFTDDFIQHGVNLADGNYHELGFDWHLGTDPRVEYYIDGVLYHTVRTNVPTIASRFWVGVWFPSASTHWAGRGAPWSIEKMFIKSISITPFSAEQSSQELVSESYPNDVFRDIK